MGSDPGIGSDPGMGNDPGIDNDPSLGSDLGDFWYGVTFSTVALGIIGTSITIGIVGPSLIQIGNVAPVRPSIVFYLEPPHSKLDALRQFGLIAPAALRAIGSTKAAKVTLRPRVDIDLD
jgi:hypothetical protein